MNGRLLTHGAAVVVLGALSAGCSSSAMRFEGLTDGLFTGSTENQRQIIRKSESQPFPGDAPVNGITQRSPISAANAPADLSGNTVQRSTLAPALAPVSSKPVAQPQASAVPTATATKTASAVSRDRYGWSEAGGTRITVRPGETVYNLSKRYGVPAKAIIEANGLSDATALAAGQEILIPTYAYGKGAPVSAPDSNPKVADARSTSGAKSDPVTPAPKPAPSDQVAVLPQSPKLKESSAAPAAADASAEKQQDSGGYTVAAGDTLFGIAKKTGVSADAIRKANGMSSGLLRVGQKLTIPAQAKVASAPAEADPVTTGTAAAKAAVQPAAYTPPAKDKKLVEQVALNADEEAPDSTGIGRMRWPVRGRVVSGFGGSGGAKNDGIDIAVPEGTPVKAAENGVVIYAGDGLKEFGNTVLVRHEDGLVTVYGHTSEIKVARGDTVRRGQEIARSGMSGAADRPKLHFEVRKDSAPVDPTTFLE